MAKFKDLCNKKFYKLTVLKRVKNSKNNKTRWLCRCDCGKEVEILAACLIRGDTKSCGCFYREKYPDSLNNNKNKKKLFDVYNAMKKRCYDEKEKSYKNYGLRGIKICDEWLIKGFLKFYVWSTENGYKEGLTIDRIDNNGNYEPNNCRWITQKENNNNRRTTVLYFYKNESLCLKHISEKYNVSYSALKYRINLKKWSIEKAVETPLKR